MARPTLYLIDGHAQIYRAYYAPFGNLTSPTGEPTRATFVFCQMLLNLLRDRRPDYLALTLDVSDETVFRVAVDPTYKSHREPPPEDLEPQKQRILEIVAALGVPILRVPGYEADDIMATLAVRHAPHDCDVILVSKDKDLEQLLGDGVRMYDPGKDQEIDAAAMLAAKGYGPAQAVEAQMLIGDSVDNVRGAHGVGPKKAAELLSKYGDVAGVIAHADELTPKLRENILEFAGRAEVVRQLVTLRRDTPVEFALGDSDVSRFRGDAARPIFEKLGFHRLTEQLVALFPDAADDVGRPLPPDPNRDREGATKPPSSTKPHAEGAEGAEAPADLLDPQSSSAPRTDTLSNSRPAAPIDTTHDARRMMEAGDYRLIDDDAALAALVEELRGVSEFAFDTETTGLRPIDADLVGISLSWQSGRACYVPVLGVGRTLSHDAVRAALGPIFANERIAKCGQNAKYDLGILTSAGMDVRGLRFDTMLASFVLDSTRRSHGIDALALELLGIRKIATTELIGKGKEQLRFDQLDTQLVCAYACEDADVAWRLRVAFEPQLRAAGLEKLFYDLELPLVGILARMEANGVALDTDLLARLSNEMADRLKQLTADIHTAAGREFNIDSTKQLGEVLFDQLKLPVIKKTKTGRSTDAEVLTELAASTAHAVPKLVLEYRELSKLKGTYVDTLPEMISPRTGRVHCSFHQTGAITGRLSSSDPNLQNIPIRTDEGAKIRRAFVPRAALRDADEGAAAARRATARADDGGPGLFDTAVAAEPQLGRRSARDSNLQPDDSDPQADWTLISADYSQIELRVLAHFSGDENLAAAFRDDRDIHQFVASQIFNVPLEQVNKEQRGRAKTVNFGIIYGQTAFGLARQTGMARGEAQAFIDAYFRQYPRIQAFMDSCIEHARRHGYVATMLGRRRAIGDIHSRNPTARAAAERLAVNTVVQGTAADIIKRAMIAIDRRIAEERRPLRMLIQVHDELVFETPQSRLADDAEMIRREMSSAIPLSVPVKVDVAAGANWLDVEDVRTK